MVVLPLRGEILNNDLITAYIAAGIGRAHGWSHIYSLALEHDMFVQLRPHAVFQDGAWYATPPVYAWLVLPLTLLSPAAAVYVWLALLGVALTAAWWIAAPEGGRTRWLWLLGALAWYPVLYSLEFVQPALLVLLIAAASWKLADLRKPYLAGAVLGLSVIKPQLVLLIPLVLLAAGRWRVVLPWALIGAALALLSLISLGADGLGDYRITLAHESQVANNRYFTLAYLLGPGLLSYAVPALAVLVTMAGAYLNRRESYGRLFALGIVASTLTPTYWHLQDFTILALAGWLFWREQPPAWQRAWLLVVVIAGEFAWPLTPLPMLVGIAVWFAFLVAPSRTPVSERALAT